jgi:hypothetical protein
MVGILDLIPFWSEFKEFVLVPMMDWIRDSCPAPIKFMLFLFFLITIGSFISFFLAFITGHYCADGGLYQMSAFNIAGRVKLLGHYIAPSLVDLPTGGSSVLIDSDMSFGSGHIIGYTCGLADGTDAMRPQFSFLGIPILDWRIWVLFAIIGLMLQAYSFVHN